MLLSVPKLLKPMTKLNKLFYLTPQLLIITILTTILLLLILGNNFSTLPYKIVKNVPLPSLKGTLVGDDSAIPKSNQEWLLYMSKLKKGLLEKYIITTTIKGEIVDISDKLGKIGGLSDYYTGEKGYYVYGGKFRLKNQGLYNTIFFSQKRMEIMKVFKKTSEGYIEKKFNDIKAGDNIEIEESLDLAISNINDGNVFHLIIKIL